MRVDFAFAVMVLLYRSKQRNFFIGDIMKLVFIRHGDPDYVHDTITPRGVTEAKSLAKRVSAWNVDKFYCSPLGRAQATAKYSLDAAGRTAVTEDWLREFYVQIKDPFTGKTRIPWDLMPSYRTKIAGMYDKDIWQNTEPLDTGDVAAEFERVKRGIDGILSDYGYTRDGGVYTTNGGSDKTVVFFCHLGVQFVVLSYLLGIAAPVLWHGFFVAPTSVTTVVTEEREKGIAAFRCKGLGDVSHLYADGIAPSDSGFFEEVFGG